MFGQAPVHLVMSASVSFLAQQGDPLDGDFLLVLESGELDSVGAARGLGRGASLQEVESVARALHDLYIVMQRWCAGGDGSDGHDSGCGARGCGFGGHGYDSCGPRAQRAAARTLEVDQVHGCDYTPCVDGEIRALARTRVAETSKGEVDVYGGYGWCVYGVRYGGDARANGAPGALYVVLLVKRHVLCLGSRTVETTLRCLAAAVSVVVPAVAEVQRG